MVTVTEYLWLKYCLIKDEASYEEKLIRDNAISQHQGINRVEKKTKNKINQLLTWLTYVLENSHEYRFLQCKESDEDKINKVSHFHKGFKWPMILLGIIIGVTTGITLFFYNGNSPINIVSILLIMVLAQWLFMLVLLFSMLPTHVKKFIPGINFLNTLFSGINLAKISINLSKWSFTKRLSADDSSKKSQYWTKILKSSSSQQILSISSIVWSQWFSVFFNIFVIVVGLCLVTFTDLAFGWASTLDFDANFVLSITDKLSYPWQTFMPGAVPTLELIEQTRYYRVSNKFISNPSQLGEWWQFILLCLVVYGLFPRVILLIWSQWMLSRTIKQSLITTRGSFELQQRLSNELISTISEKRPESIDEDIDTSGESYINIQTQELSLYQKLDRDVTSIHIGDLVLDEKAYLNLFNVEPNVREKGKVLPIGIDGLDFRKQSIKDIIENNRTSDFVIWGKSWEPPTLEIIDIIDEIKRSISENKLKMILYGINQNEYGEMELMPASQEEIAMWQHSLTRHNIILDILRIKS